MNEVEEFERIERLEGGGDSEKSSKEFITFQVNFAQSDVSD